MGLSRRKFTKEFKITALRQLDAGVSIATVARSCEINPNLLHRWRRDFQQAPEHASIKVEVPCRPDGRNLMAHFALVRPVMATHVSVKADSFHSTLYPLSNNNSFTAYNPE